MTSQTAKFQQTPEHNHHQCVSLALSTAQSLCKERGVLLTTIRFQVLSLIWESHKAVKAYELLDRLRPLQAAAKPATIYRTLDFLIEQGLIHRVESLNAFVGCRCSDQQHEQLLFICKLCEQVDERPAIDVMKALLDESKQAGFMVHSKALEIHGICSSCQTKTETV